MYGDHLVISSTLSSKMARNCLNGSRVPALESTLDHLQFTLLPSDEFSTPSRDRLHLSIMSCTTNSLQPSQDMQLMMSLMKNYGTLCSPSMVLTKLSKRPLLSMSKPHLILCIKTSSTPIDLMIPILIPTPPLPHPNLRMMTPLLLQIHPLYHR